nr:hypothetical protein [uncultured Noviherbaspirillum sp.]
MSNWNMNNFQHSEAEADADFAAAAAHQARHAVNEWRQHAAELEANHDKAMLEMIGRVKGHEVLKFAALKELERFDPSNQLLDPEYRKKLFDTTHSAEIARILDERKAEAEKKEAERQAAFKSARKKKRSKLTTFFIIALFCFLVYMKIEGYF